MFQFIYSPLKVEKIDLLPYKAIRSQKNSSECKWSLPLKNGSHRREKWNHKETQIWDFKIIEETKTREGETLNYLSTENGQP